MVNVWVGVWGMKVRMAGTAFGFEDLRLWPKLVRRGPLCFELTQGVGEEEVVFWAAASSTLWAGV